MPRMLDVPPADPELKELLCQKQPVLYVDDKPTHYLITGDQTQIGIGGAPTRATTLPEEAKERKKYPIATGFLEYFPDAVVAISNVSWRGGQQHHPEKPLHWDRNKSTDEADTMMRHFMQRGTLDTDGVRHMAKCAWRCLALLQKEIEAEKK